MDNYTQIRKALQDICRQEGNNYVFTADVQKVEGQMCEVVVGDLVLSEVRLCSVIDGNDNNLVIEPKENSKVLVMDMSGGQMRDLVVIKVSEVESISVNGGKLGGLIKIDELTRKINSLIDTFNNHTHLVNTTGSASKQSGTASATMNKMESLNKSDYEDEKIRH
ncbi:MAG: hypothetical protein IJ180_09605 [Bacteroidales bacterium]|nr:hypothetical protein [Bacteroidales bacterium]